MAEDLHALQPDASNQHEITLLQAFLLSTAIALWSAEVTASLRADMESRGGSPQG